MSESESPAKIKLISADGEEFVVEAKVAAKSSLVKHLLDDITQEEDEQYPEVPITEVRGDVLAKVIEYCERHKDSPVFITSNNPTKKITDISEWDKRFLRVDQEMLFSIIKAANYLDVTPLLDVACKTVADMIKGRSPADVRRIFNIVNDFTPEEIEQIKLDNEWVEEDET